MEKEYTREELEVLIAKEELIYKRKIVEVIEYTDALIEQYQKGKIDA